MTPQTTTSVLAAAIDLVSCTNGSVTTNRQVKGTPNGAIGGVVSENMARQERELTQKLAGISAGITNTNSQLRACLPENLRVPTEAALVKTGVLLAPRDAKQSLRVQRNAFGRVVGLANAAGARGCDRQLRFDRALAIAGILTSEGVATSVITFAGQNIAEPISFNACA